MWETTTDGKRIAATSLAGWRGLTAVVALLFFLAAPVESRAAEGGGDDAPEVTTPFASIKFFIEYNETDGDIGLQVFVGGEPPYGKLNGFGPDGEKILAVGPERGLKMQGISELFFESAEPPLATFSLEAFLARFPEGSYRFESETITATNQKGDGMLTHVIPAGPVITSPKEGEVVDPSTTVVVWEPVTHTAALNPPQRPVTIVGYQVIVTREDPIRAFSVDVGPEVNSVSVPAEFMEPGTEYEVEILSIEKSDNQTISLLSFETSD